MTDERLILAIGRLERAISRLEAQPVPSETTADDALKAAEARIAEIETRHEKLRASASEAIERIDRLLAKEAD